MKKYWCMIIAVFLQSFEASAERLSVTGSIVLSEDKVFSAGTVSDGGGAANSGVYANGTTGIVNSSYDITATINHRGIHTISSGNITLIGSGTNNINTYGNLTGIYTQHANTSIIIEDFNVTANNNTGSGIYNLAVMRFSGTSGDNLLSSHNNNIEGIYNGSNMIIERMNIDIYENTAKGLSSQAGGKTTITGLVDGSNWLKSNANTSHGILSDGNGSEMNINNMSITSNNNITGLYASNRGKVNIVGAASGNNKIVVNGNKDGVTNGWGIYVQHNNSQIIIENMDVEASGNNKNNIAAGAGNNFINITGKASRNTLITNSAGSGYAIEVELTGSSVNITNMNVYASDNHLAYLYGGGNIKFDNSSVNMVTADDVFVTDNTGGVINIIDTSFVGATNFLRATNTSVATVNVTDSSIDGIIVTDVGAVSKFSLEDSSWSNIGISTISEYIADNAQIYLDTFFDGDGTTTEKLIIRDSSSGNTELYVTSIGTNGAETIGNGILVVDQSSASIKNGTFTLFGGVVDSGVYEYELHNESNERFYLRSNGVLTNIAKTIANVPAINIHIAKTGMNTLRKRMGELRNNDSKELNGVWARSYARNLKVSENIDSEMNIFGFESGYDYRIYDDCDNKIYAGLMAGYLYTDNIKTRNTRTSRGTGHANTPTIGVYATWLNYDGWFMDATFRSFWNSVSMSAYTSQNQAISFDTKRQFSAGSLEFGRKKEFHTDRYSKVVFETKSEIGYMYAKSDIFRTNQNTYISYGSTESIQGRFGFMLGYSSELENGNIVEPFAEANIIHEFGGVTDIGYDGGYYKSNIKGSSFEFGGGLNAQLNKSWSVYSDIMYEKGGVIEAVSTNVGIRYTF